MKEEYKTIKEFPKYEVSNLGNIRNKISKRILNARLSNNGYLRVNLRKGNCKYEKPITKMIHKLVSEEFIPKIEGKTYVNHIDGNKQNNKVDNLEWCTPSENSIHSFKNGLQKALKGKNNKFSKKIYCYDKETKELLNIFYGCREIERTLNISRRDVWNNCNGKQKTCKNYIFSYKEVVQP